MLGAREKGRMWPLRAEVNARAAGGPSNDDLLGETEKRDPGRRSAGELDQWQERILIHRAILDELVRMDRRATSDETVMPVIEGLLDRELDRRQDLSEPHRKEVRELVIREIEWFGPLAVLVADPSVTDVVVNTFDKVYVDRGGRMERAGVRFRDGRHLAELVQAIAQRTGRCLNDETPMIDACLPDGTRVNATLPPVTVGSPTLSIRRFGGHRLRMADLLLHGMLSPEMTEFLRYLVRSRQNLIVSGGTSSGKSTLLAAMGESIGSHERIVTIEDAVEIRLDQENLVQMETRPANSRGQRPIAARDLVTNSLRMRPDRIIVGEVRGPEALDMLQAMNTGHEGSMTTIHANSPRDALTRLETMVLMAGFDLPSRVIREQITAAVDFIVQVRRFDDGVRRVESIVELVGMEQTIIQTQEIFRFEVQEQNGMRVAGDFIPTGILPRVMADLAGRNIRIPVELFRKHRLEPARLGAT